MSSKILTFSQMWPKLVRKLKVLGRYYQTQEASMKVLLPYKNKPKIMVLDHLPAHINLHKPYQLKFILQFQRHQRQNWKEQQNILPALEFLSMSKQESMLRE